MDGSGNQLFSGAAFTGYQDRGIGGGHLFNHGDDFLDFWAAADELVGCDFFLADLVLQVSVLLLLLHVRQGLMYHRPEFVGCKGFGEIIIGPHLHHLHCRSYAGISGDDDDMGIRIGFFNSVKQFHAPQAAHLEVGDNDMERLIRHHFQCIISV